MDVEVKVDDVETIKGRRWVVYLNGIVVLYEDSNSVSKPDAVFDFVDAQVESIPVEGFEQSGVRLYSKTRGNEWILQNDDPSFTKMWLTVLSTGNNRFKSSISTNPVSRAISSNALIASREKDLFDKREELTSHDVEEYRNLEKTRNDCFLAILGDLFESQIK